MTATAEAFTATAVQLGDTVLYHSRDGRISAAIVIAAPQEDAGLSLAVFRTGERVAIYARHGVHELGSPECEAAMEAAAAQVALEDAEADADAPTVTGGQHYPVRYWMPRQ